MEAEKVDQIGAGTEDEQPSPDHEIELDRMLLALCMRGPRRDCVMHMAWERLALAYAILLPPVLVLVFVAIMVFESDYTHFLRILFFAVST